MVLFRMHIDKSDDLIWVCANVIYLGMGTTIDITPKCSCGETHGLDYDIGDPYSSADYLPCVNITPNYGRTNEAN